jgi:hypothetical protein
MFSGAAANTAVRTTASAAAAAVAGARPVSFTGFKLCGAPSSHKLSGAEAIPSSSAPSRSANGGGRHHVPGASTDTVRNGVPARTTETISRTDTTRYGVESLAVLQQQVTFLRDEVSQRDKVIAEMKAAIEVLERRLAAAGLDSAEAIEADSRKCEHAEEPYPCSAVLVRTSTELAAALRAHVADIAVPSGAVLRIQDGVVIGNYALTIHGPANVPPQEAPIIETNFVVKGNKASLTAKRVHLRSPSTAEPCVNASGGSSVTLNTCVVSGGRDGVYLSGKASVTSINTTFRGNLRGVVESLQCNAHLERCVFDGNEFHCVLLNKPAKDRETRVRDEVIGRQNTFGGGRADVAMAYNPIQDKYSVLYRGEATHTLPDELCTLNLVDAAW